MVRVAETENARTGVLLTERKTAVDRVNSMVDDMFLNRFFAEYIIGIGMVFGKGIYKNSLADLYDVCTHSGQSLLLHKTADYCRVSCTSLGASAARLIP